MTLRTRRPSLLILLPILFTRTLSVLSLEQPSPTASQQPEPEPEPEPKPKHQDSNDEEYYEPTQTINLNANVNANVNPKSHSERFTIDHSFPSRVYEYDPYKWDPNTIFGAPYGGYARATRSRLASLPLRFVGDAGFRSSGLGGVTSRGGLGLGLGLGLLGGGRGGANMGEPSSSSNAVVGNDGDPYFTVRDGDGRLFACRVYNDDALLPVSIFDSVFDEAYEVGMDDDVLYADKGTASASSSSRMSGNDQDPQHKSNHQDQHDHDNHHHHHDDGGFQTEHIEIALSKLENRCAQIHQGWWSYEWCHESDVTQFHVHIDQAANSLEEAMATALKVGRQRVSGSGGGAIKGSGHDDDDDDADVEDDTKNQDVEGGLRVESITTVGVYGDRTIRTDIVTNPNKSTWDNGMDAFDDDNDDLFFDLDDHDPTSSSSNKKKDDTTTSSDIPDDVPIVKIYDTFHNGDYCEASKSQRTIQITLECCRDNIIAATNKKNKKEESPNKEQLSKIIQMLESRPLDENADFYHPITPIAILMGIHEKQTCVYEAMVCTNVLCRPELAQIRQETENIRLGRDALWRPLESIGSSSSVSSSSGSGKTTDLPVSDLAASLHRLHKQRTTNTNDTKQKKTTQSTANDESVRSILDRALRSKCLEIKNGWWSYGFCYRRNVYQFHEATKLDTTRGVIKTSIEDKYTLGNYDVEGSEGFTDEEELKRMHMPNDSSSADGVQEDDQDGEMDGKEGDGANGKNSGGNESFGENGAYYTQEYIYGDVCEDPDVTDSTVKGGNVNDGGGIERAVTVRFMCGERLDIVSVDEDSTCHYVLVLTVPALCAHKYFEIPIIETQVVKCLPVAGEEVVF